MAKEKIINIAVIAHVVRTHDVGSLTARLVRVFKHAGLAVGQMLPQRQKGVLGVDCCHGMSADGSRPARRLSRRRLVDGRRRSMDWIRAHAVSL